jgi:methyl-accepting chemotaxis protein
MFGVWSRLPITARIMAVASLCLIALSGTLLLVVKDAVEQTVFSQLQSEVTTAANFHRYLVESKGPAAIKDGNLVFGDYVANGDFSIVDTVKQKTGAEATLFEFENGKNIRVATTVANTNGVGRGVGTELIGPAAAAYQQGQNYSGVNPILGQDYIAVYDLIRDASGQQIGYILTAVPMTVFYATSGNIVRMVVMIASAATLIAMLLLFLVARSIGRSIKQVAKTADDLGRVHLPRLVSVAEALAKGDLTINIDMHIEPVPVRGQDEMGRMAVRFNDMIGGINHTAEAISEAVTSLRSLVGEVKASATNLAETSVQLGSVAQQTGAAVQQVSQAVQNVAAGAQDTSNSAQQSNASVANLGQAVDSVARSASEQAMQAQAARATTVEMAGGVEQVAERADSVATASQQTKQTAHNGSEAVKDTTDAMAEIQAVVGQAADKVRELGGYAEKIGAVVDTIDDIAAQTNLLALNAAIEAARAGEHGRGFAVVADEVRKLAERSSRETKQIAELIGQVRSGTQEAVSAMERGATTVHHGTAKAEQAGRALEAILEAVEETVRQVADIASSSQEMAAGARNVTESMLAISSAIEDNSAATEEMAAQTNQLSDAIHAIASVAEEQSAATEEVSASAEEMSAQVEEMSAQAQELSSTAEQLTALVGRFKTEAHAEATEPTPIRRLRAA